MLMSYLRSAVIPPLEPSDNYGPRLYIADYPQPSPNTPVIKTPRILRHVDLLKSPHKFAYSFEKYQVDPSVRYNDSIVVAETFNRFFYLNLHTEGPWSRTLWGETFHGVRRCLQQFKEPSEIYLGYFKVGHLYPTIDLTQFPYDAVVRIMSLWKHYYHTHIDYLPPIAHAYVELDTIAGYVLPEYRTQDDNVHDWLEHDTSDLHSPNEYCAKLVKFLEGSRKRPHEPLLTYADYIRSRWLWATSGANHESRAKLDGRLLNTKFGTAISLTDEELFQRVYASLHPTPKYSQLSIFVKPDERGYKKRLIANTDIGLYLTTAYVRYLIEYLCGVKPSWFSGDVTFDMDLQVVHQLQLGNRAVPLDESKFDYHVSRAQWLGLAHALDALFPGNEGVKAFYIVLNRTKYQFGDIRGKWLKGMPSGLAITALVNTLFNQIKQQQIPSSIHMALGDDVLVFNDNVTLSALSEYYSGYGAEINVNKNWTSRQYAEFLHNLYFTNGRIAYPARLYGSMIFAQAFTDDTPLARLHQIASLFENLYLRFALPMDEQRVAKDLVRSVRNILPGFDHETAMLWLHIPKVLNGYGRLPYKDCEFVLFHNKQEKIYYRDTILAVPPQIKYTDFHFEIRSFIINKGVYYRRGRPFALPPIRSLEQWEQRLNLAEPGISKLKYKEGLSVIPLPSVDWISPSRLSVIASQEMFYAWPNCTGNRRAINQRLIAASLGLITQARTILAQQYVSLYA